MRARLKILGIVIPAVFLVDQLTKQLVVRLVPLGSSYPVIPGLFDIVHTRNRGAAFGFMANMPDSIRVPFFFVVSALALALITFYFFRSSDTRKTTYIGLALILGGALGNIYDRLLLGEVIDFLSFHWYDQVVQWGWGTFGIRFRLEWPAFNLADMAISISVIGLMILMTRK